MMTFNTIMLKGAQVGGPGSLLAQRCDEQTVVAHEAPLLNSERINILRFLPVLQEDC